MNPLGKLLGPRWSSIPTVPMLYGLARFDALAAATGDYTVATSICAIAGASRPSVRPWK